MITIGDSSAVFNKLLEKAQKQDAYWAEKLKVEFALALQKKMKRNGISNAELARRIGKKPPYITKVLGGNENFTIETMAKLARAVGAKVEIHVCDKDDGIKWMGVVSRPRTSGLYRSSWASVVQTRTDIDLGGQDEPAALSA